MMYGNSRDSLLSDQCFVDRNLMIKLLGTISARHQLRDHALLLMEISQFFSVLAKTI